MAEVTKLIMVVFGIHLMLILLGITDVPGSALYTFLQNPTAWDSTQFMAFLSDLTLLVAAGAIVVGSFFIKSDILIFAGLTSLFISFGIGLAHLFSIIEASSNNAVAMLFVSPIIIIYLVIVIKFWRGTA